MNPPPRLPPWLKSRRQMRSVVFGVVWYSEENWAKVKASAVDPERFEASYAEWLLMANDTFQKFADHGIKAEKVLVDSDALLAWCLAHVKKNDAAARSKYVAELQSRAASSH